MREAEGPARGLTGRWTGGGRDRGQAFPIYLTAVAAFLFLALAFFAVGRAGATKNGAQTAADAAALAAAQTYRDQLRTGLLTAVGAGGPWADWLAGRLGDPEAACGSAEPYAQANGARVQGRCATSGGLLPVSFTVTVESAAAVGKSVVPGTEDRHATATARAVVEPRCWGPLPAPQTPPPSGGPSGSPSGGPAPSASPGSGAPAQGKPAVEIVCDGETVRIEPDRPGAPVKAATLFTVRLADGA
ncbi:pilus assembly protein TadG-related protein [Streptomyces nondiastaticus]|uniref:pilus assembly protein TadG-related protein n=1 Tax=Streptomyces nondiastaticus TaxID=3154512 RepID=UPI0034396FC7